MNIINFKAENFRNLKNIELNPCGSINIFYGDNAQGKTNLIESIHTFSGVKSFRGSKSSEMISFGEKKMKLSIKINDEERIQTGEIIVNEKKKYY